jgi:hypothetical protein
VTWQLSDLAPGLYVLALGWILDRLLRRFADPVPPRVWAAIAVLVTLFLGPALFGGRILLPLDNLRGEVPFQAQAPTRPEGNPLQGDLLTLVAPLQKEVRSAWSAGRWPLWNRAMGAGLPLLADPQAQALQPLQLLALPFGLARAAGVVAALRLVLALAFGFLFFRRLGLSGPAASLGAVSYGLGGFLGLWLGWPIANAAALLPAALWAVDWICARGWRRDAIAFVAALATLLLGGQPESVLYGLGVTAAFAGTRLLDTERGRRASALRRLAVCAALAVALAAPALGPALEFLPHTLRAADRAATSPASSPSAWSGRAVQRLVPIAAPNAFGNGRYGDPSGAVYWGESNTNEDASGFAGTLTLVLALAALAAPRRIAHQRFALALLAASLLLLAPPPFLERGLVALPLWRLSASGHHRLLLVVNLALAWLGACGLEHAMRGTVRRGWLLAAAGAVAALVAWATLAHSHPVHPEALAVLRFGWLKLQAKLLLAGVFLALAASRVRAAAVVVAALVAGELLLAHVEANPSAPKSAFPPPSPALAYLAAQPGSSRVAALDAALPANLATLWGLRDARLYDPAAPADYARLVRPLGEPGGARPERFASEEHRLYDALGVRYLLTEPLRALHGEEVLVYAESDAWVWERPRASELVALLPPDPYDAARLAFRELGPQRLQATVKIESARLLAASILDDGNWRLLDGGARVVTRAPLIGAKLEAGEHRLELLYRPPVFLRGLLLAALAAVAALAWFLPSPRRPASIAPPPPIDASFRRKMTR